MTFLSFMMYDGKFTAFQLYGILYHTKGVGGMRFRLGVFIVGVLFLFQGDVYQTSYFDARYSLLQNPIVIEAGSLQQFDPYAYLLKNRHALTEEEKNRFPVSGSVDINKLGQYEVKYGEDFVLSVSIEDHIAPELKLKTLTLQQNQDFSWTKENLAGIIETISDNHTEQKTLMEQFSCEDVDTSKAGQQNVRCSVKDENGNEKAVSLHVQVNAPVAVAAYVPPKISEPVQKEEPKTVTITLPIPQYTREEMVQIQQVVILVNRIRAEHGLSPLALDINLYHAVTYQRAKEVAMLYSHTRPNGKQCYTIFKDYHIGYHSTGENIAKGQQRAEDVVNDWMSSPRHRENILRAEFTIISIGVQGNGDDKVWVQEFFS